MPLKSSSRFKRQCGRYYIKGHFFIIISIIIGIFILLKDLVMKIVHCQNSCSNSKKNIEEEYNSLYFVGQSDIGQIASFYFPAYHVVYANGIAYDIYSIRELGQLRPASQWLTFPLPDEKNTVKPWMPNVQPTKTFPFFRSPKTKTGLAYVDDIYVTTDPSLIDRINNIKHMFVRHNLSVSSIQWRMGKQNRTACNGQEYEGESHHILNLSPGAIGNPTQQRYCAITIQHVQIWHEIAASNSIASLILEDDAIFVPFFKEKFDRFVYTVIRTGALKIGETQCASSRANISANEWVNQDPAFVIGACANLRDQSFPPEVHDAPPLLSTHKEKFSRCSHAYLLTPCSAQALLRQMHIKKIPFHVIDWLQTYLGQLSPTLQPFWLDPPLVYQGSQAHDLANISTFGHSRTQED